MDGVLLQTSRGTFEPTNLDFHSIEPKPSAAPTPPHYPVHAVASDIDAHAAWERDAAHLADPADRVQQTSTNVYPHAIPDDDGQVTTHEAHGAVAAQSRALPEISTEPGDVSMLDFRDSEMTWEIHHESVRDMPARIRRAAKAGDTTVVIR